MPRTSRSLGLALLALAAPLLGGLSASAGEDVAPPSAPTTPLPVEAPAGTPATDGSAAKGTAPAADDPRYLPISEVKPGMRGYGYTVRKGTQLDRFEVEVIDVVKNYLVKQDVILIHCLGEDFADHQVAQGMSGSPIYFGGRMAGALSYAFWWSKHAIAGVTPIHDMLAEGVRPLEGRPTGALPPTPLRDAARTKDASASTNIDEPHGRMQPIGTPLALGGFSSEGRADVARRLAEHLPGHRFHMVGAPGAAAPGVGGLEARLEPGCAITVDIVRGDFSASALGTVTAIDGPLVYGFGHSFEMLGETLLPASLGYVYSTIATRDISFKLGGPLQEIGALVQDRQACIVCDTAQRAPMVPIQLSFRNAVTKREEVFRYEITPNTTFFQPMMVATIAQSFRKAEATLGPNTKRMRMTVKLKGLEEWTYEDVIAGFDGGFQRSLMGLIDRPLIHRTQRPEFESFRLDVDVEHVDRRAWIRAATPARDEVRRGERVGILIEMETAEHGPPVYERMEVEIPPDAPEGNYVIGIVGGDLVAADVPSPLNIDDMPGLYAAFLKSTELVCLLPRAQVDVDVAGRLLRRVPLSSLPRLVRSPEARTLGVRQVQDRVRKPTQYVIDGRGNATVRVVR